MSANGIGVPSTIIEGNILDKLEEFKPLIEEENIARGWVETNFLSCFAISNILEMDLDEYTWP